MITATTSDEQLMRDFQQGSREAFADLFCRYRDPIFGFFRRRLYEVARAEELAQEAFLAVLKGVTRYEPRATFRTYLFGIAFNLLAAEHRKPITLNVTVQDAPALGASVETEMWVRQALEKLDGRDREILLLREYEQFSYAEIADLVKVPVNTVRSRLFRARMALKELLVPQQGLS